MATLVAGAANIPWPKEVVPPKAEPAPFIPLARAPELLPQPANDAVAHPKARVRAKKAVEFKRGEAIVVMSGAAGIGMATGAVTALLVGGEAAAPIAASLWFVFAFALHQAAKSFTQLLRAGAWREAGLYALHLFAFAPWPLSVLFSTPEMGVYWLGLGGLIGTLAIFLMSARVQANIVYRVCGHMMLMSAITSLQAMMLSFVH